MDPREIRNLSQREGDVLRALGIDPKEEKKALLWRINGQGNHGWILKKERKAPLWRRRKCAKGSGDGPYKEEGSSIEEEGMGQGHQSWTLKRERKLYWGGREK